MSRRFSGLALTALLSWAVLVVGHNLFFLIADGPNFGAALARTGDGGIWDETVRATLAIAALTGLAATARLAYLGWLLRRLGGECAPGRLSARAYARDLFALWVRLATASTMLFVLQENFERWNAGLSLPGLAVLGSFGPIGPVPVLLIVSLVFSAVAALFRWGIETLEARIAAIRVGVLPHARPSRQVCPDDPQWPATSILGRHLAGRAPPSPLPC
jgi:hypothetical protein